MSHGRVSGVSMGYYRAGNDNNQSLRLPSVDLPSIIGPETSFSEFLELHGKFDKNEWIVGEWDRYATYIASELLSEELELREQLWEEMRDIDAISLEQHNFATFHPPYYETLANFPLQKDHPSFSYHVPINSDNGITLEQLNRINETLSDTFFTVIGITVNMGYDPIKAGVIYAMNFVFARQIYIETGRTDFNDKYEELKEEWDRRDSTWMDFGLCVFGPPQLNDARAPWPSGEPVDFADSHWEKLFDTLLSEFPGFDYQEWLDRLIEDDW